MIEYFGVENIIYFILAALAFMAFQLDRLSSNALKHIDSLQERVYMLEERVGIKEEFDMDPIGFARKEDDER